jgi:hypothetical protein
MATPALAARARVLQRCRGSAVSRPPPSAAPPASPGFGALVAGIAVFILLGVPLLAWVWESLNRLLSGIVEPSRLLGAAVALALLLLLWRVLARTVQRWDAARHPDDPARRSP